MSEYDPTDLPQQQRELDDRQLRNKLKSDSEGADFKWLMGSKRGRRIVWRFLEKARVFQPVFNSNSLVMAHAEGQRNIGLIILSLVNTQCPELYPVMAKENANGTGNTDDAGA